MFWMQCGERTDANDLVVCAEPHAAWATVHRRGAAVRPFDLPVRLVSHDDAALV